MKRGLILSLFTIMFLTNFVLATDVAYVLKNDQRVDQGFLDVFDEMSLSVDLIESKDVGGVDFSSYEFIFVGDERFRNAQDIPINDYPIVIANYYHGDEWGITDGDGISKMGSNMPLRVDKSGEIIQVYDRARYNLGMAAIPYYFIDDENSMGFMSVARTYINGEYTFGDVIAYSDQGAGKCFFGITKTKYWTDEAKELFEDCVMYVMGVSKLHDVMIDVGYSNSVNGIRIKDVNTSEYLNETDKLMCYKDYKIDFKTKNVGDYTEDVSITGQFDSFNWSSSRDDLDPGSYTTAGSKTINITFSPGFYTIEVMSEIAYDDNLGDNSASRDVEVVC